jgi:UDPglucose 6-dehydrogenase
MKIGIIGLGYVGSAVAYSYPHLKILVNDPKHQGMSVDIDVLKENCDAIFVCVPTPSDDEGRCDTSILTSVIDQLIGYEGIVISKSTAPPLFYKQLEKNSGLKLAHVPEFLTQARAKFDYVNPHKVLVGCRKKLREEVADILMNSEINFERIKIEYCSIEEASFFKYMANTILAMKVIINNEFYDLAQTLDVEWEKISKIARKDFRLGETHWAVPGPDGSKGYGGACFPKDTRAVQRMASEMSVDMSILDAVIKKNNIYRGE